jgi:hypothetical protein
MLPTPWHGSDRGERAAEGCRRQVWVGSTRPSVAWVQDMLPRRRRPGRSDRHDRGWLMGLVNTRDVGHVGSRGHSGGRSLRPSESVGRDNTRPTADAPQAVAHDQ